jgi:FKBP-type peptidyl-prolyl cis-trans isomerase
MPFSTLSRFLQKVFAMSDSAKAELQIHELRAGEGPTAQSGTLVKVHYTGWLFEDGQATTQFDSSRSRGPFVFTLGAGEVIPGWDQGVAGMQVGGLRQLIIPPHLGYGARGAGGVIPPNATLQFEVELLGI